MKNENTIRTLASQIVNFPGRFINGRLTKPKVEFNQLKNGEGGIVDYKGNRIAAYKDESRKLYSFSPVCRHLAAS